MGMYPEVYLGADPVDCEAADRADEARIRQRFKTSGLAGRRSPACHTAGSPPAAAPMPDAQRERKSNLRSQMRQKLATMTDDERHRASLAACERLTKLDAFQHAAVVMMYMPLAGEVDLTPVAIRCFQSGRTVCVPKVDWKRREMSAVEVTAFDDHVMDTDEHGLRAPRDSRPILPSVIDLVVVPGLAFDTRGHRLGRGGGYYDRFLKRLRRAAAIVGLAFDQQIIDEVPADECDVSVGIVVTDRRVTHARSSPVK